MTVSVLQENYEYMLAIGVIGALGFGYGTGANDVANAFGTSVGSGALTNRQACFLASIFEFFGALVLGRVSTSTIAGGIADRNVFTSNPAAYAYGMMWTLIVGTVWLIWATFYGLNVSSTHSIIGGIMGFALSYSSKGVLWLVDAPATQAVQIPGGIIPIVVAWFFAPITTGFASAVLFIILRTLVLRTENSFNKALYLLPVFVLFTSWINIYFVFTKGAKKQFTENKDDWDDNKSAWVAIIIAIGFALLSIGLIPLARMHAGRLHTVYAANDENTPVAQPEQLKTIESQSKMIEGQSDAGNGMMTPRKSINTGTPRKIEVQPKPIEPNDSEKGMGAPKVKVVEAGNDTDGRMTGIEYLIKNRNEITMQSCWSHIVKADLASRNADYKFMHMDVNETVVEIHTRAEKFDPRTESVFKVLQIFSACCVMFAHGAGEVGYMAGPLTTINEFYNTGLVPKNVVAPMWVLVISALSLVIGLATYGQRVTRAMGKEISTITASRGFCAEISTAIVIMVAAQYGLPTSSSQCITGGIVGIGFAEGVGGVNWRRFGETFASWVATLFVVGLGTASLYAQGLAAPKRYP